MQKLKTKTKVKITLTTIIFLLFSLGIFVFLFDKQDNINELNVSIKATNGEVRGMPSNYILGESYELEAFNNEPSYTFNGWYLNGVLVSTNDTYIVTIKDNLNLEASFSIVSNYNINLHYDDITFHWGSVEYGSSSTELDITNTFTKTHYRFLDYYVGIFNEDNYKGKYANIESINIPSSSIYDWIYLENIESIAYYNGTSYVEATPISQYGTIEADIHISCVYVPIYYSVNFTYEGASTTIDYKEMDKLIINFNPNYSGHTLSHWVDGNGVSYNENSYVTSQLNLTAQYNEISNTGTYYDNITISDPATTATQLFNLININPSSYDQAKVTLQYADADPLNSDNVLSIYTRASLTGLWTSGGTIWNREHVFPQSKLDGASAPSNSKNDTHNLRAADNRPGNYINSQRSNLKYVLGSGPAGLASGGFWPGEDDKGDVARISMYMALRYSPNKSISGLIAFLENNISLSLALRWNYEDPVDDFESNRNQVIFSYQGNRNPFIDNSAYVDCVFGTYIQPVGKYSFNYQEKLLVIKIEVYYEVKYYA